MFIKRYMRMSRTQLDTKFQWLIVVTFAMFFNSVKLFATETYTDLTLNDAVRVGLSNSVQQKISLQSAAIAESQYQEALSARWPTVSFQASVTRLGEDPTFTLPSTNISIASLATPLNGLLGGSVIPPTLTTGERKIKLMDRDTAIATLQMMMPLYTGGKITSMVNQANLGKEIAQEEYHRSTLQVIRDIKRYYYAVKLTQSLSELAHETVETLQSTRDLTKVMYEGGSASANKLDYLKTEMALGYAKSLEADFSAKEKSAVSALTLAMGIPWNSAIKIAHDDFPKSNNQPALERLISQAQQFNPEIGMIKLAVKVADEKVSEAKSAYYPQVAFTGNVKHIENGYDGGLLNDDNKNSWTIGVVMNMPIFDFGKTSNHVNSAKLQRNQMDEKQLLVEQGLATQIKNLFINLDAANQQILLSQKTAEFAKDYERLTSQAYQIGASKAEDMIQASIYSAIVEGSYLRAQHDSANNEAEIEYFIGSQVN